MRQECGYWTGRECKRQKACALETLVYSQEAKGGGPNPQGALVGGAYWDIDRWEEYVGRTNALAKKVNCGKQPRLRTVLEQITGRKRQEGELIQDVPVSLPKAA